MKISLVLGGVAAFALVAGCNKLPGLSKVGVGGSSSSGGGSAPIPKVTKTPEVEDEAPFEIRLLETHARTLEQYAETKSDHQMRKQIPQVEDALAAARAKYPDRDYAPYDKLLVDADAAIAAIEQQRKAGDDAVSRRMRAREQLDAVLRDIDSVSPPSPEVAVAMIERLRVMEARCKDEQLPALGDDIADKCKQVAGPYRFAQASIDRAFERVDEDLDTVEQYKIPQAAKGELWFNSGGSDYLDAVAWVEPRLAAIDELAALGGVADTAARRTRARELAAAFERAALAAAKRDAAPKGMLVTASITASAVAQTASDGKVIRAGVDKSSVRPVKNDFGVVTGKSGTGYAIYQPAGKEYCIMRAYSASAEANGKDWGFGSGETMKLEITRCK